MSVDHARIKMARHGWVFLTLVPLFVAAAVLFAVWSVQSEPGSSPTSSQLAVLAGVCAALAVFAAADLIVVLRRRRRERPSRRGAR